VAIGISTAVAETHAKARLPLKDRSRSIGIALLDSSLPELSPDSRCLRHPLRTQHERQLEIDFGCPKGRISVLIGSPGVFTANPVSREFHSSFRALARVQQLSRIAARARNPIDLEGQASRS